jgi:hypothetical protein
MIMCWSIFGCGNNIKKDLELHKKTPNNSKLIFMDNLQDESWRKYIKERKDRVSSKISLYLINFLSFNHCKQLFDFDLFDVLNFIIYLF